MFKERVWPGKKSETSNLKIEEAGSWLKAVSIDDKQIIEEYKKPIVLVNVGSILGFDIGFTIHE